MRLKVYICCWWLYMLCSYMLLVIIYMLCAYMLLVKSFTCELVVNCWCTHVLEYNWCRLMKITWSMYCCCRILVHTQLVWWLSSPCWWLDTYVFIIRGDMMCLYASGRRPRRWKKFGTTHSWVGLVTLYVSRKSHVCLWAWCEYLLVLYVLVDCWIWNLVLECSLLRMFEFMIVYARYYWDACLILFVLIMINVILTPSGMWMGRRHACLDAFAWCVLLWGAGASSFIAHV